MPRYTVVRYGGGFSRPGWANVIDTRTNTKVASFASWQHGRAWERLAWADAYAREDADQRARALACTASHVDHRRRYTGPAVCAQCGTIIPFWGKRT